MNNILVTGSNGQLGSEIRELSKKFKDYRFSFSDINDLDITKFDDVKDFLVNRNIEIIINCAAYTFVEKAEQQTEFANKLNHLAVANLAEICKEKKITLVHISTDYVFDGKNAKPYTENDKTNPQTVYGKTKLAGENAIKKINPPNSIIIRTSWIYSKFGNNFVNTMLKLADINKEITVVSDQFGTPTNAQDLANTILKILPFIQNKNVKIYHYSNEGKCSWYDFAKTIFKVSKKEIKLKPIKSSDFKSNINRPKYSVLDKNLIKSKFDLNIKNWEESFVKSFENN